LGAGDPIHVTHRPDHGVTVALTFRALMGEAELLPALVDLPGLAEKARVVARRRVSGADPGP
jgi:hypothetical protein